MNIYSTYDYVEDDSATVYVVRTTLDRSSAVVLYPAYRRSGPRLRRIVHTGTHSDGASDRDWALDAGCVIRPAESLRLVRRWDERPATAASTDNADLARFFAAVREQGGTLFLYGSRLLDTATPRSDWDLLMTVDGDPRAVVERATALLAGARFFSPDELGAFFTLPVGRRPVPFDDLVRILSRTLPYLYVGGVQVDIMIANRSWAEGIPALIDDDSEGASIRGVIRPGKGESYLMPRAVSLETDPDQATATLLYPAWFLQGLERLAGTRVELHNLRRDGSGRYWYGTRHSTLRLAGGPT